VEFDAIVIGSGQGGTPLSQRLADEGWQVALVERAHLGGTCINTGCTPTKTMVASAQVAHYARHAARWGVHATEVSVDLPRVVARKNAVVEAFRAGKTKQVEERPNLKLVRGQARFGGPHRIVVGSEHLHARHVFIDVGTRPALPPVPGLDSVGALTNASLMNLTELPEHLLVLGAGYIGMEFGQMFHRFGSEVTIVHRGDAILGREDPDVADELRRALEAEGLRFVLGTEPTAARRESGRVVLTVQGRAGTSTLAGSHVLVATGRRPNTDDLGLEHAGVETDARGYIKVNGRRETTAPGVWALGDVTGGPAFTHLSYNDYQVIAANLLEGGNRSTDDRIVPYSLFTDPQLGRVGLSEAEAAARGHRLAVGKVPMSHVARAIERDETAGFMKLVVDADTDRILGAAILGSEGGELVQVFSALMFARAPYTVLEDAIYIHPTLAEGFFSLIENVKPVAAPMSRSAAGGS